MSTNEITLLCTGSGRMLGWDKVARVVAALGLQLTVQSWQPPAADDEPVGVVVERAPWGSDGWRLVRQGGSPRRVEWPQKVAQPRAVTDLYEELLEQEGPRPYREP